MEKKDIYEICHQVQQNSGCHVKYIQKLIRLYKKTDFEEFVILFMQCLEICFEMKFMPKNAFVDRYFRFAASFTAKLSEENKQTEDDGNQSEEVQTHPFLKRIISEVLQYHNLDDFRARYHSCEFIKLLLKSLQDDTYVDNDTCNKIQEAMLERIKDSNAKIRLQACTALARLQEPLNRVCPVIAAYIQALNDSSALVRRFVVENIAPTAITIAKMVEHTRDVDFSVRAGAFTKCATVPPHIFKIADRQGILNQGFIEQDKVSKKIFLEVLLPKWLTAYDGKFLTMIKAIKLDADEDDIKNTEFLSKNVLEVYFGLHTIVDIIEQLPINEDKVIPNNKLCSESVLYWFNLHKFLRANPTFEDYIETIVPELTPFCQYIEGIIKEKCIDKVEEWQYLETQYILHQLFEMIGNFDFADEVGRKNLHELILKLLKDYKFEIRNITQMVKILYKIHANINLLSNELYELITEIREHYVDKEPTAQDIGHRNFRLAGLKVKLNVLAEDIEDAVLEKDFKMAEVKRSEHKLIEDKIEEIMNEPLEVEKLKVVQQDDATTYKCLDIIISLLKLPVLKTLPMSLKELKDNLVSSLINTNNMKMYYKLFNMISLCALLDETIAKDNLKLLCTPAMAYRILPDYDKTTLITSIGAVSDLMRIYGSELFCTDKIKQKKLYRQDFDTAESVDFESLSCENIIEVIVDMMDDDDDEIREMAGNALSKLVSNGVMTSPSLISRIILKWFNPLTEQSDPKLHHMFGQCILHYRNEVSDSKDVLEAAIIPTLNAIGNAPRTSPLADIHVENALKVLAYLTSEKIPNDFVNSHQNLSFLLVNQILNKPLDKCVVLWTKFLCYLEPSTDVAALKEIVATATSALVDVVDKTARKHLEKYILILTTENPNDTNATANTNVTVGDEVSNAATLPTIDEEGENVIEAVTSPDDGTSPKSKQKTAKDTKKTGDDSPKAKHRKGEEIGEDDLFEAERNEDTSPKAKQPKISKKKQSPKSVGVIATRRNKDTSPKSKQKRGGVAKKTPSPKNKNTESPKPNMSRGIDETPKTRYAKIGRLGTKRLSPREINKTGYSSNDSSISSKGKKQGTSKDFETKRNKIGSPKSKRQMIKKIQSSPSKKKKTGNSSSSSAKTGENDSFETERSKTGSANAKQKQITKVQREKKKTGSSNDDTSSSSAKTGENDSFETERGKNGIPKAKQKKIKEVQSSEAKKTKAGSSSFDTSSSSAKTGENDSFETERSKTGSPKAKQTKINKVQSSQAKKKTTESSSFDTSSSSAKTGENDVFETERSKTGSANAKQTKITKVQSSQAKKTKAGSSSFDTSSSSAKTGENDVFETERSKTGSSKAKQTKITKVQSSQAKKKKTGSSSDDTAEEMSEDDLFETEPSKSPKTKQKSKNVQSSQAKKKKFGSSSDDTSNSKAKKQKGGSDGANNSKAKKQKGGSEDDFVESGRNIRNNAKRKIATKKHQISDSDLSSADIVDNPNKGNKRAKRLKLQKGIEMRKQSNSDSGSSKTLQTRKNAKVSPRSDASSRKNSRLSSTKRTSKIGVQVYKKQMHKPAAKRVSSSAINSSSNIGTEKAREPMSSSEISDLSDSSSDQDVAKVKPKTTKKVAKIKGKIHQGRKQTYKVKKRKTLVAKSGKQNRRSARVEAAIIVISSGESDKNSPTTSKVNCKKEITFSSSVKSSSSSVVSDDESYPITSPKNGKSKNVEKVAKAKTVKSRMQNSAKKQKVGGVKNQNSPRRQAMIDARRSKSSVNNDSSQSDDDFVPKSPSKTQGGKSPRRLAMEAGRRSKSSSQSDEAQKLVKAGGKAGKSPGRSPPRRQATARNKPSVNNESGEGSEKQGDKDSDYSSSKHKSPSSSSSEDIEESDRKETRGLLKSQKKNETNKQKIASKELKIKAKSSKNSDNSSKLKSKKKATKFDEMINALNTNIAKVTSNSKENHIRKSFRTSLKANKNSGKSVASKTSPRTAKATKDSDYSSTPGFKSADNRLSLRKSPRALDINLNLDSSESEVETDDESVVPLTTRIHNQNSPKLGIMKQKKMPRNRSISSSDDSSIERAPPTKMLRIPKKTLRAPEKKVQAPRKQVANKPKAGPVRNKAASEDSSDAAAEEVVKERKTLSNRTEINKRSSGTIATETMDAAGDASKPAHRTFEDSDNSLDTTSKDTEMQPSPIRKSNRPTRETWKKREAIRQSWLKSPNKLDQNGKTMQRTAKSFSELSTTTTSSGKSIRKSPMASVKRKKPRSRSTSMASSIDETILHTIIQDDEMEMGVISLLNDSSSSSNTSKKNSSRLNKVVTTTISPDSDSPKRRKKKYR